MDSSNLRETLETIDSTIAKFNDDIEKGKKLKRLSANQDFIDLILNGYLEDEASNLFSMLTNPGGIIDYSEETLRARLAGITHFKGYVGTKGNPGTIEMAAMAAPLSKEREEQYRREVTANAELEG